MTHCATSAVLVVHTDNGDGFDKDEKNSNSQESKVDDYYFCDAQRHLHFSKLVLWRGLATVRQLEYRF
jgi:hypothetical protein